MKKKEIKQAIGGIIIALSDNDISTIAKVNTSGMSSLLVMLRKAVNAQTTKNLEKTHELDQVRIDLDKLEKDFHLLLANQNGCEVNSNLRDRASRLVSNWCNSTELGSPTFIEVTDEDNLDESEVEYHRFSIRMQLPLDMVALALNNLGVLAYRAKASGLKVGYTNFSSWDHIDEPKELLFTVDIERYGD